MPDRYEGFSRVRNDNWVFDEILCALGYKPGVAPPVVNRRGDTPPYLSPYQQRLLANHCPEVLALARHRMAAPMRVLKRAQPGSPIDPDAWANEQIDDQLAGLVNLTVRIPTEDFLKAMRDSDRSRAVADFLFGRAIKATWDSVRLMNGDLERLQP